MRRNNAGQQANRKGFQTPQQGPVSRQASTAAEMRAGRAPEVSHAGYPGMSGIRSGSKPIHPSGASSNESRVSAGTDPNLGKSNTQGSLPSGMKSGAAPVGGMSKPGAGKTQADKDNQRAKIGRNGYAQGGIVERVSDGMEAIGKALGTEKGKAIEKADKAISGKQDQAGGESKRAGSIDSAERKALGYAQGGKVNRFGADKKPIAPAAGGNGGIPGVASTIPLKQPGGTPSTGVTASGRMQPSFQGADTPQPGGATQDSGDNKLRGLRTAPLKRTTGAPSLPRPRRA